MFPQSQKPNLKLIIYIFVFPQSQKPNLKHQLWFGQYTQDVVKVRFSSLVYYGILNGHTFLSPSFSSARSVWQTSATVLTYSVDCVRGHPLMNRSTSVNGAVFLGTDSLDYFPLETGAHFNLFVFFRYRLCPITQSHSVQFSYGISAWKKPICTPPHLLQHCF